MSKLPYTDADLHAEAARQHAALTDDPDFMGVGEGMEDRYVQSTVIDEDPDFEREGSTWGELLPYNHDDGNAYNQAQREIHKLISHAADVSQWAVNLGADGLEPDEHELTWKAGEQPIVRVHFAFHPGMRPESRDYLVTAVGEALHDQMQRAAEAPATPDS
jgi:hypothetical protein